MKFIQMIRYNILLTKKCTFNKKIYSVCYIFFIVLYKYDNDGAGYSKYSGFTKTKSGGKRYYVTGHACKGWRKIDGEWYYFRFSDGIAATGTEVIGGKKYYFNSDGTWSGKRSRTAAKKAGLVHSPMRMAKLQQRKCPKRIFRLFTVW